MLSGASVSNQNIVEAISSGSFIRLSGIIPTAKSFATSDLINDSGTFDYEIAVKDHCFACTAGSGSSCGGSLI